MPRAGISPRLLKSCRGTSWLGWGIGSLSSRPAFGIGIYWSEEDFSFVAEVPERPSRPLSPMGREGERLAWEKMEHIDDHQATG